MFSRATPTEIVDAKVASILFYLLYSKSRKEGGIIHGIINSITAFTQIEREY